MSPPKHPLPPTGTPKPPPEKSSFLQTCDRLSLFLKEKGANFKFDDTGVSSAKGTSVDLLSSIDDEPDEKVEKSAKSRRRPPPQSAQMTVFYEGEVLVLDNVPADRARDVMVMAKNGGPRGSKVPPPAVDVSGDLPIARRASLHKFLAKRKDRATVRQHHPHPYQLQNQSPGGSSSTHEQHIFDLNM